LRFSNISRYIQVVSFVLIVACLFVGNAVAEEQRNSVWGGIGFGVSWPTSEYENNNVQDLGLSLHLTIQRGALLLGARTTRNGETSQFDNREAFSDIALLIGTVKASNRHLFSLAAGPALVSGYTILSTEIDTGDCYLDCPMVEEKYSKEPVGGLALEGQIYWKPIRMLGFGIYVYGNINNENTFFGVTLSVIGGYFPDSDR